MRRRVVVTGLGTVSPIGNDTPSFWQAVKEGRSGVGKITRFNTDDYPVSIAGEVKDFDASSLLEPKEAKKLDKFTLYSLAAAKEAIADSAIKDGSVDPERYGVVLGNGIGGFESIEEGYEKLLTKGARRIPVLTVPKMITNIAPGNVGIMINAQGPCYSVVTACASGTDAIGNAAMWIQNGTADVMVAGGVEAPITKLGLAGFCIIQALSSRYCDTPERASRPFDKERDGFVLGEGAGILILEEYEHAVKRGAKIYCELSGYGISCDANHITAPHPEGRGAVQAMNMAINAAGLNPLDIDYVNAHGTSTPLNDKTESLAIRKVFGEHAYSGLKVSSTKSMTGHCLGAAGGIEAVAAILAIRDQYFPATINYENPDPDCDLDYVPNKGESGKIDAAISNSLGFGGHNSVILFTKM
ncbi:MAG: beta-ketoacyl-ACP synthase II [Spirochaetia bacterium]|jgi:3-oxoacyl-[acyl-carrier-protein] synthase II|nr:beta-ketoacyl-ACP synthase II [Spirochaetia bacterium]